MIPRRRARTDRPTEPEALRLRFPGRRVEGRHDGAALMAEKCLGLLTGGYSVTGAPISDFRETACPRDRIHVRSAVGCISWKRASSRSLRARLFR